MNDNDLDKLIKESLSAEEATYYEQLDEPNLLDKMSLIYSGKMKWISVLQSIAMIGIFIFAVYASIQFFNSTDVTMMIKWGFGAVMGFMASSMVKLLLIQYMQEKTILRQLRRLELQLAHTVKEGR